MSNVCAKPGCGNSVNLWLDFVPNEQRVLERGSRGDSSFGLCEAHAARFTVPQGWTFERLDRPLGSGDSDPTTTDATADPTPPSPSPPHRGHSRERPWFLAATEHETGRAVVDAVAAPDVPDGRSNVEPSVGSLLHRAFHGPDRAADAHRAALDELESRRVARSHGDDGAIELPFPPSESEQHVAVS